MEHALALKEAAGGNSVATTQQLNPLLYRKRIVDRAKRIDRHLEKLIAQAAAYIVGETRAHQQYRAPMPHESTKALRRTDNGAKIHF